MAQINENETLWGQDYDWKNSGDEWSQSWGGTFMHWHGTLRPRIASHLPTGTILEIACGYGRWTQYLKDLCNELIAVDLAENCVQACKQRFSSCAHTSFYKNDGISLDMVKDSSVDLVFSFDSLVHANERAINGYLSQLPRVLKKSGVAFIHHSNLGEYRLHSVAGKIPTLRKLGVASGLLEYGHWRDPQVDASKVERWAESHGLQCIAQELVLWGSAKRTFLDCMSTIVPKDSPHIRENRILRNRNFMQEAHNFSQITKLYSP